MGMAPGGMPMPFARGREVAMARGLDFDLHIDIDRARVRQSVESSIRRAIAEGRLVAGTRLPSARTLAAALGVARNTVASAYAQLTAEGWLVAARGAGSRVAPRPARPSSRNRERPERPRHDLRPGYPNVALFPRRDWLAAARTALVDAPPDVFEFPDPQGLFELRDEVAAYVGRVRGVRASADQVVICSGAINAIALMCSVLQARGARQAAVESYCWWYAVNVARAAGLRIVAVPVDDEGLRVGDLAASGPADAVLVTPTHQFPTGATLSSVRREDLLTWAKESDSLVIEDDYDGEFWYDGLPMSALQPEAPERVVYVGTVSKSLTPALRIAWLVLPDDMVEEVVLHKTLVGTQASALDQRTLAQFIRSGRYDHHVRRCRLAYRRRRDHLIAELAARAPDATLEAVSGGLHAVIRLPDGMTEEDALARAAERGLAFEVLSRFHAGATSQPESIVVGFGAALDHGFRAAVAALIDLLAGR
jgi:GntR family transcriptional regulator/MocR family aminotransferase